MLAAGRSEIAKSLAQKLKKKEELAAHKGNNYVMVLAYLPTAMAWYSGPATPLSRNQMAAGSMCGQEELFLKVDQFPPEFPKFCGIFFGRKSETRDRRICPRKEIGVYPFKLFDAVSYATPFTTA